MRMTIVLDDDLVKEAVELTGIDSKRELVREALKVLIETRKRKNLLDFVQRRPALWPPHILRWLGANITFSALEKANITFSALEKADRNQGKKGLWLKMLDRIGFGIKI